MDIDHFRNILYICVELLQMIHISKNGQKKVSTEGPEGNMPLFSYICGMNIYFSLRFGVLLKCPIL